MPELTARVTFSWVPTDSLRDPKRAVVKLEGGQLYVELPMGEQGLRGPQGDNRPTFDWRGRVANVNALPTDLGSQHAGYGFIADNTRHAHVWNGAQWFDVGEIVGEQGDPGSPAALDVRNISQSAPGFDGSASIGGAPGSQYIDFVLPRGQQGIQGQRGIPGVAGAIVDAEDFDGSVAPAQGNVPVWDASTQKWRPGQPGKSLEGPWTLSESAFTATENNITAGSKTIAKLSIPEQPKPYRPIVFGSTGIVSGESANQRVDVDVRIGSTSGQLVGQGIGYMISATTSVQIMPAFGTAVTPGSNTGVVSSGTPVELQVIAVRRVGGTFWAHGNPGSYLSVWAQPVGG